MHALPHPTSVPVAAAPGRGWTRRWLIRHEPQDAQAINAGTSLPALVQRVLMARGLLIPNDIQRFCQPSLNDLHDPGLLPNIDAAAARLIDAVRSNQHIVIYGDYDVDGICATAILFHTLKALSPHARIQCYVPHRLDEGYGLNADALRQLRTGGAEVAVSVDCGVTACHAASVARDIGLDLIITDHHSLPANDGPLPDVLALVHPALPGSKYPFAELCGAGVAFKLAWRMATMWCNSQRVSESLQQTLLSMLPLTALASIADVVQLIGENRVLTAFGLRMIKHTKLPGLRALIEASGLMDEKIDSQKVGFVLGPRLNACGRMGHAAAAVRMFTDAPPDEASRIAHQLTEQNQQRQAVERRILDEAMALAEDRGMTADHCRAIILAHESWHPGVVGIVCSRLVDRFGRPTVLLQTQGELCKGSARSIDGYSIYQGLAASSQWLTTYGGHAMAAGLSLPAANLEPFADALIAHANSCIAVDQLIPSLAIDCQAKLEEISVEAVRRLQELSPFGRGNRSPVVLLRDVVLTAPPQQIGANGRHLAIQVRQNGSSAPRVIRGVWWRAGERAADLAAGMRLDIAIEPKINDWNGRLNIEAEIRDIRVANPA